MREFLTSGQVGNIELNAQKKIREDIQNRWDQLGFTEGLDGTIKENVATLYENEAKHLIYEATASDNSGSFETVVFPIIRRVFSKLLANDIVSVQAMNLPVGKLFFILPVTSKREWEVPADGAQAAAEGDLVDGTTGRHKGLMGYDRTNRNKEGRVEPRYYLPDETIADLEKDKWYVPQLNQTPADATTYEAALKAAQDAGLGVTALRQDGPEVTQYFEKSLYDLFYNDFLYDNSKGKVTIKVGQASLAKLTPRGMEDFAAGDAVQVNGFDGTVRNVILKVTGFSSFNASKLTGPDGNEMDTEGFLASLKVITTEARRERRWRAFYMRRSSNDARTLARSSGNSSSKCMVSPVMGWSSVNLNECRNWRLSPRFADSAFGMPVRYSGSPTSGCFAYSMCTRIWCVRPVKSLQSMRL